MDVTELAYGTKEHRRTPIQRHESRPEDLGHEVIELGKVAVGGMVTVGVIGALGTAFHKD